MKFSFTTVDDDDVSVHIDFETDFWDVAANKLKSLLDASEFIVTEQQLANHFQTRADTMLDLRANSMDKIKKEKKNG